MIESSKAIQEASKATGKAIDALRESGGFFRQVFGGLVADGVGIIADKVKFYRIEKANLLAKKTEERLKKMGVKETISVPPKLAIPLIENATVEDDDELHTLWSQLLANAMNPKTSHQVKHIHASILKELEPLDVRILSNIANKKIEKSPDEKFNEVLFERSGIAAELNETENTVELSLMNLIRLGCITPGFVSGAVRMGGHNLSAYKGTELISLSPLGLSMVLAMR